MRRSLYIVVLSLIVFGLQAKRQQTIQLTILQTSDTHSRIEPIAATSNDKYADYGGVARRNALIQAERETDKDLLLFDCGDFCQGTPYFNFFKGDVETSLINLLGYDAVAIGNHEFDFGLENMARIYQKLKCPVLCANYNVANTVLNGHVKPYTIIKRKGLKIGVFGIGARMEGLVQTSKCQGVIYEDPTETAQKIADELRNKKKCDVVICLSHLGTDIRGEEVDEKVISKTNNIDLVLGGHTHTFMKEPRMYKNKDGKETPLLHSGKNGINVGKVILTITSKK